MMTVVGRGCTGRVLITLSIYLCVQCDGHAGPSTSADTCITCVTFVTAQYDLFCVEKCH